MGPTNDSSAQCVSTPALPARGDTLTWTGSSRYHPKSLHAVLTAKDWPGVPRARRPLDGLLDVLDAEARVVRPGLPLVLEEPLLPVIWGKGASRPAYNPISPRRIRSRRRNPGCGTSGRVSELSSSSCTTMLAKKEIL